MKNQFFAFFLLLLSLSQAWAKWELGSPQVWVQKDKIVAGINPEASNNNVSIEYFENKLFMVWRSSKDHFASEHTITNVAFSEDLGKTWKLDLQFAIKADVREGLLKKFNDKLHLYYFEGGSSSTAFEPKRVVHRERLADGKWSEPESISGPHEVVWDIKEHQGKLYKLSYHGPHYSIAPAMLEVKFEESTDGVKWTPVDGAKDSIVYRGGVSEVSIEFDDEGNLYGVGRNEDGDETEFGAQIFTAKAGSLSKWTSLKKSLPERYDSPRMFKHKGELYLLSRKPSNVFDRDYPLPFSVRRWVYLGLYSLGTIRSAIFHFDRKLERPVFMHELPSAGDNAYPSIVKLAPDHYLVANYSSPFEHQSWMWIRGQTSDVGTLIYGVDLKWKE